MSMSKTDYELIASAISLSIEAGRTEARHEPITGMGVDEWRRRTAQIEGKIELARQLADVFAGENERFDTERFLYAAGVTF